MKISWDGYGSEVYHVCTYSGIMTMYLSLSFFRLCVCFLCFSSRVLENLNLFLFFLSDDSFTSLRLLLRRYMVRIQWNLLHGKIRTYTDIYRYQHVERESMYIGVVRFYLLSFSLFLRSSPLFSFLFFSFSFSPLTCFLSFFLSLFLVASALVSPPLHLNLSMKLLLTLLLLLLFLPPLLLLLSHHLLYVKKRKKLEMMKKKKRYTGIS